MLLFLNIDFLYVLFIRKSRTHESVKVSILRSVFVLVISLWKGDSILCSVPTDVSGTNKLYHDPQDRSR